MKKIIFVLLIFIIPSAFAQEEITLQIDLLDTGQAHIKIVSQNPESFDELKSLITNPSVKSIYEDQLSSIFGDIRNLDIYTGKKSLIIEFDSALANNQDNVWYVPRKDFEGMIKSPSTLSVSLPGGYALIKTLPEPAKKTVSNATWDDVDFIPEITYGKKKTSWRWVVLAVLVVFLIAFYITHRIKR